MLHIRYFARTLVRQPGFALTVVLSLALGIGANSAMFAVAKTILLDRLAVRDPESLVLLVAPAQRQSQELSRTVRRMAASHGLATTERHDALLCTVVEVAFEPAPC